MGNLNSLSVNLQHGDAYFVAVQPRNSTGLSVFSNIEEVKIAQQGAQGYQVFGFNDLGMHCYDSGFSVFSILPLLNVLHAQVIRKGSSPLILGETVSVSYKAMADSTGSINITSAGKPDFWDYALPLFGAALPMVSSDLIAATATFALKFPGYLFLI
ncbi:MAG: hypothetical protein GY846_17545 [Deltaproteobacteria bacterium]|nr:hypothetical protein [Deltaproteobacteria bacterium]